MKFYLDAGGRIHLYTHLVRDAETGEPIRWCQSAKHAAYVAKNCGRRAEIVPQPVREIPADKYFSSTEEAEAYLKGEAFPART